MYKYLLVALILPAVAFATNVRQCPGKPFPNSVRVLGCDFMPCNAPHGSDMIMEMEFTVTNRIDAFSPSIMATAFGVVTPYPLPGDLLVGCNHLTNAFCPLDAGERPTYRFVFNISRIFPPIPVTVDLTLTDNAGREFACFSVDLRVTL